MSTLFSLPNELIDAVVEAIDDRPTLIALTQTCRKLHSVAEAQLFKNIYIRDGPSVTRLAKALEHRPERFHAIENLEATPNKYGWEGIEQMPQLVGRMKRLRSLRVESPLINTGRFQAWWPEGSMTEYMDLFEVANGIQPAAGMEGAFRCLTSFTLHSHASDDRSYQFNAIEPIFLSPTLRYIHVSCVKFHPDALETVAPRLSPHFKSTPLETLILERCVATGRSLQIILSIPRALRSFVLLMDIFSVIFREGPEGQIHRISGLLEAIEQQSDSLEYFRYARAMINDPFHPDRHSSLEDCSFLLRSYAAALRDSATGLSTFRKLHTVDFDCHSDVTAVLFDAQLAPPALHTVGLSGFDYVYAKTWRHLLVYISAIASATSFSHLRLYSKPCRQDFDDVSKIFTSPVFTETPHREVLLAVVRLLKGRAGVELVSACNWTGSMCPPFLYREPVPKEKVMFDSRKKCTEGEEDGEDQRFEMEPYVPRGRPGLRSFWCVGPRIF